jgi:CheY-like chemotaxis protein
MPGNEAMNDFPRNPRDTPVSNLLDGLRILLLEDELLIAMDVEQLCYDNGAAVVALARTLDEIDVDASLGSFDVAIVDLMLEGVSTLDFARRLQGAAIPFVFASGYSEDDGLKASFPQVPLVTKPYSGQDLVDAIAGVCGRRRVEA